MERKKMDTTNLNTEVKMLTGKAKEDFEYWLLTEGNEMIKNGSIEYDLYYMCKYMIPENMVCAKVIEWLDSVSIYIEIGAICVDGHAQYDYNIQENNTLNGMNGHTFPDRQSATKAAIKQANKIYNER